MSIRIETSTNNIPWQQVADLLAFYELSNDNAATQERIFKNSFSVIFLFDEGQLIGVGRTLSDGVCQAAIYNIALDERYHGQGLGKQIIQALVETVAQCNIILYTHPQTVSLYEHVGFRRMKTGMAKYREDSLEELTKLDFI
ncbi:GNAT family N-acetyltransferase [Pectobacterium colocasium]|uniref:GNAT family N-acetyltransferase n=1 Tax=Pectobacterium TaxID=122277 RepID=UPI00279F6B47|nr:GNAT family N-acetyltransferase [Pectobacterium sp. PL152]WED67637.1 GNAT family N-acetyltransferase [Pectobacterium colocasium]